MHMVVVSTYPPRRCGLATFAADLRTALLANLPHWQVDIYAVDRDGLHYGSEVVGVLPQDDPAAYRRAAGQIAATHPDLVLIQHEYGIFGGADGRHVGALAAELQAREVPYAVTLHTVLSRPSDGERAAVADLCRGARVVTCFTATARRIAAVTGLSELDRTVVVPHGVPAGLATPGDADTAIGPTLAATLAQVEGRRVLSTFGLLRPGKGLETAVRAMPEVVRRHPDVHYAIAGATHPETLRASGERYRQRLRDLADELAVADHVSFVDAFLTEAELARLLGHTEVYLTPYRTDQQTCSGALTFALAAGCPVVSTAYPYARDLLRPPGGPERGVVVDFEDPPAFAEAVIALLDDPVRLTAARQAATEFGAALTWPAVGARFAVEFAAAVPERADAAEPTPAAVAGTGPRSRS